MKYIFFAIIMILIFSCQQEKENISQKEESNSEKIILSKQKIESAGIETGTLRYIHLSEKIYCKGKLTAKSNNRVRYSAPFEGFIKRIYIQNGSYVKKGTLLLTMEHTNFIEIQKEYLITKSNSEYLQKEYERQKTLFESKAGKKKEFERVSSEDDKVKTELSALQIRLRMLNINPDKLSSENIRSEVNLYATISGYVNEIDIALGQFVNSENVLFEIINNKGFFLELDVFERDIQKIQIGQKLKFDYSLPESKDTFYIAEIVSLGNYVDPLSKTFKVYARPPEQIDGMRHGMFINVEIQLSEEHVLALPDEALIIEGERTYIFLAENESNFIKKEIRTGIKSDGFTQILNEEMEGKKIVVKGANYVKAEEGEE